MEKMRAIMERLRKDPPAELAGEKVEGMSDYQKGLRGLPESNVLELVTASGKVLIRPSGTEPKIKLYLSARKGSMAEAAAQNQAVLEQLKQMYLN